MMKFLLTLFAFLFINSVFGQVYQLMPQYGYEGKRMNFDSTLSIPTVCGVPTLKSNLLKKSAIAHDTCNNRFYVYDAKTMTWAQVSGGSSIDTTSLSNRINNKVDSINRVSDSVKYYKNGTAYFGYIDSVGAGSDTASVVKATVKNAEATTLNRGEVVYLYGATGNMASVKRAKNTSDTFSSKTFAIVKDNILANGTGTVITQGVVDKLNLGSYSEGDILWLDSIAGQFTKTKPSAPYHGVFIGVVQRANNGNGQIYTKIQNGYELGELHNVSINGQANNDVLYYQSSTQLWKAKSAYQLVDTSSLSSRINTKMAYSDTASLSNRINTKMGYSDTTSISNRINLKVNISDTASMLTNYAKTNLVNTKLNISDTAAMLTNYAKTNLVNTKLNSSDSTIYFSKYRSDTMRTNIYAAINGKQASGTYITSSDTSVFQRKNIAAYSFVANSTSSAANMTTQTFKDTTGTYTGTIAWTGTTAPTTATATFRYVQIGRMVTLTINVFYTTAGTALTQAVIPFMANFPTPTEPSGFGAASDFLFHGSGLFVSGLSTMPSLYPRAFIRANAADNGYDVIIGASAGVNVKAIYATITYFTN